jgi:anti-sigma B factor antagonist
MKKKEEKQDMSVVELPGRVSGTAVTEMIETVRSVLDRNAKNIAVDFANTDYIDSAGIGSLVSLLRETKRRNVSLSLRNLTAPIQSLFHDCDMDKIFTIEKENGVEEATVDIFGDTVDIKLDIDQECKGDVCVLHCKGIMNHPIGSRIFKQQFLLVLANYKKVVLDFDELTFFDSLSISVMLTMNKLLNQTGGKMRITGVNYIVDELFSTLKIFDIIPYYRTLDDAVKDFE